MIPQRYEVRLRGRVPDAMTAMLAPMEVTSVDDSTTVLAGVIRDQAELTGLLQAVDQLGLVLLGIEPRFSPDPSAASSG